MRQSARAVLATMTQSVWTESGEVEDIPFFDLQSLDRPARAAKEDTVAEASERQPAIACPRCHKLGKQYSPQIPVCPQCYELLWKHALAWTDADYVRAWLHNRLVASGALQDDSALTATGYDRRLIRSALVRAKEEGLDWRVLPRYLRPDGKPFYMTTAARLKLLVAACVDGKVAPFVPPAPEDGAPLGPTKGRKKTATPKKTGRPRGRPRKAATATAKTTKLERSA